MHGGYAVFITPKTLFGALKPPISQSSEGGAFATLRYLPVGLRRALCPAFFLPSGILHFFTPWVGPLAISL